MKTVHLMELIKKVCRKEFNIVFDNKYSGLNGVQIFFTTLKKFKPNFGPKEDNRLAK